MSPSAFPLTATLTAGLALVNFTGCGSEVEPVSGRVTVDGKPLAGAVVTFQPGTKKRDGPTPSGTGSSGRTDSDGRFTLQQIQPDRPGAIAGDHIVTISSPSAASAPASLKVQPLPKAWSDGTKQFKVPSGGTREANFEIKTR